MSSGEQDVVRVFHALGEQVARSLASGQGRRAQDATGWRRLPSARPTDLVFVTSTGEGTCAVAHVTRGSISFPRPWPVRVSLRFGASYEPAIALMPVVTLSPQPILVEEPGLGDPESDDEDSDAEGSDTGGEAADDPDTVKLRGERDVPEAARRLTDLILGHDLAIIERFDTVDAIDAHLADERLTPIGEAITLRPLLLAAAGRHDDARRTLDDHRAHTGTDRRQDADYRRFARQLRRRLDEDAFSVPPIEETLWLVARDSLPEAPGLRKIMNRAHAGSAGDKAVRALSRGRSHQELVGLLTAEYAARGLDVSPIRIAKQAMTMVQQTRGGLREGLRTFGKLRSAITQGVDLWQRHDEPDPDWLRPPANATYEVATDRQHHVTVTLDPDAGAYLARVAAEAPRRLAHTVLVDLWLSRDDGTGSGGDGADNGDPQPTVTVHLGERAVGTLSAWCVRQFADDFARADYFDELPRLPGILAADLGPEPLLETYAPRAG